MLLWWKHRYEPSNILYLLLSFLTVTGSITIISSVGPISCVQNLLKSLLLQPRGTIVILTSADILRWSLPVCISPNDFSRDQILSPNCPLPDPFTSYGCEVLFKKHTLGGMVRRSWTYHTSGCLFFKQKWIIFLLAELEVACGSDLNPYRSIILLPFRPCRFKFRSFSLCVSKVDSEVVGSRSFAFAYKSWVLPSAT